MKTVGAKLLVTFGVVFIIFTAALLYWSDRISHRHVGNLAAHQAKMALKFDLAIREYVAESIRPIMYKLVGDNEFIPETMSTSFVARSIFEKVRQDFPDYILKFSSDDPRNPVNQAGPEELEIIRYFNENPDRKIWEGEIAMNGSRYAAIFNARRMRDECLRCHGDPVDAPASLIAMYGDKAGFHRPLGEVVAMDTVGIPVSKMHVQIHNELGRNFIIIGCGLILLISILYMIVKIHISNRLGGIAKQFISAAEQDSYKDIKPLQVTGQDEISALAESYNILAEKLQGYYFSLEHEIEEKNLFNEDLQKENAARIEAEKELKSLHNHLEARVEERTAELEQANSLMQKEVTERLEREKEIKASHSELDQIFNSVSDGMRVIDLEYTIIKVNRAFQQLIDPDQDPVGRKCYDVFPGETCHTSDCPLQRIMNGEEGCEYEIDKQKADGEEINCLVTVTAYKNVDGELVGVIESFKDITERQQMMLSLMDSLSRAQELAGQIALKHKELQNAHAELKNAQAQILQREKMASIGQLAAGVAHEINNPIGFISSNLGTLRKYVSRFIDFIALQEKVLGSLNSLEQVLDAKKKIKFEYIRDDAIDLIDESLDGAMRVAEIVQNLKGFSRINEAKTKMADINDCLETTLKIIWNELKYKATVHKEYGELSQTLCNPQELNQVFMNILINAAHAIENQGDITIRTVDEKDRIMVMISDTGSGIPADKIDNIFEPFFTTKETGKGTGLGLSISYDIVKKHNGTISVASEPGKGTTFTISLPVVTGQPQEGGTHAS